MIVPRKETPYVQCNDSMYQYSLYAKTCLKEHYCYANDLIFLPLHAHSYIFSHKVSFCSGICQQHHTVYAKFINLMPWIMILIVKLKLEIE